MVFQETSLKYETRMIAVGFSCKGRRRGTPLSRRLLRVVIAAVAAAAGLHSLGRHPLPPHLQHHQGRPQVWAPRMQSFFFKKETTSHIGEQPNWRGGTSLTSLVCCYLFGINKVKMVRRVGNPYKIPKGQGKSQDNLQLSTMRFSLSSYAVQEVHVRISDMSYPLLPASEKHGAVF